jgi:hypothetical protein
MWQERQEREIDTSHEVSNGATVVLVLVAALVDPTTVAVELFAE